VTGSKETSYTINDVLGLDYSDPIWDSLVSQLSVNQMASLCANGGWGTASIPSISKPYCSHSDGTSGFNRAIASMETGYATNYPCAPLIASTWNWKMAYQFGSSVGSEAQAADIQGWYGPACDTHRSPFGGRNFEYYSEDPLIGGTMVSYTVKGAQEKGLYCFLKHFAGAETEPDRSGKYTWMSEQAAREIYLKPFEYAVKLGGTTAIMTAYNRLGGTRCSGSYALLTEVLRNEWGFHGCVISDYFCGGNAMDEDEFIRAGNDLKLFPGGKASDFNDLSSATAVKALQKSTKNILYSYVQTRYINVTAEGLDMSSAIGTKSEVYPWWIWILGTIDFVVLAGGATWAILVTIKLKKKQTPVKA
jgi:beta-glucosidase